MPKFTPIFDFEFTFLEFDFSNHEKLNLNGKWFYNCTFFTKSFCKLKFWLLFYEINKFKD